jgi:hypothetical protein
MHGSGWRFWAVLAGALAVSRAAHVGILWADEDYHLAAAIQLLHGKLLYRDLWYDKPPLNAVLMLAFGAWPGWPLRLASVAWELAGAAAIHRFARHLWGEREARWAAALFVFFHIFYLPSTAIPLEPDTLMILPHVLAVYWAWRGRTAWAGAAAGVCFLLSTKGLFVLPACWVFAPRAWLALGAGFAVPVSIAGLWLAGTGAFAAYIDQVWRWGLLYASAPKPEETPLLRLANWAGFHAALVVGAAMAFLKRREARGKLAAWLALGLAAAAIGWRLPPRYLNQAFPALLLLGAAGLAQVRARSWTAAVVAVALAVPAARFGPRYALLLAGRSEDWRDTFMDRESRRVAALLGALARPGDTLFIWGYRPNIVAYTRLPIAGQLWESQPVTMVPADRHLGAATPLDAAWARRNQQQLARTAPTFIIDGLSAYNPQLELKKFPLLETWFRGYCEVARSGGSTIYRRCAP